MDFIYFDEDIKTKIGNRKALLYGLNDISKSALMWLIDMGVYVSGFLLPDTQGELCHIRYLNKPMLTMKDIDTHMDDYVIIDVLGRNTQIFSDIDCSVMKLCSLKKDMRQVVIYGAGIIGHDVYDFCQKIGINIQYFCDSDPYKWHTKYCGKIVLSLEELHNMPEATVIMGLRDAIADEVGRKLQNDGIIKEYFSWKNSCKPYQLGMKLKDGNMTINPIFIRYLQKLILKEKKELIVWGDKSDIQSIRRKLTFLDLEFKYGIDCDGFTGNQDDIDYINPFDLMKTPLSNVVIWVLDDVKEQAEKLLLSLGIDKRIKCFSGNSNINLYWHVCLDPTMGYTAKFGNKDYPFICGNSKVCSGKKIGVLGGSTSDPFLYMETSWPQHLLDIAQENNVSVTVYNGATAGYNSSQELLRFIRDLSHHKLDMLISYSGFNESISNYFQNNFIHKYQADLFSRCAKTNYSGTSKVRYGHEVCFGSCIVDSAEHWLHQERMIHGICHEFGIKFLAVLQPTLYTENDSNEKMEILEHMLADEMQRGVEEFMNRVKQIQREKQYPWLVDFTDILQGSTDVYWDSAHLTSKGNAIIAQKIFSLIQNMDRR